MWRHHRLAAGDQSCSHGRPAATPGELGHDPIQSDWIEAHIIDHYITRPLKLADGLAIAPDEPGVGVTFDWQKLHEFEEKRIG
ncbi:hypothetical protein ACVDG8_008125 [Mesorhizobium sp. ORM8.1]